MYRKAGCMAHMIVIGMPTPLPIEPGREVVVPEEYHGERRRRGQRQAWAVRGAGRVIVWHRIWGVGART